MNRPSRESECLGSGTPCRSNGRRWAILARSVVLGLLVVLGATSAQATPSVHFELEWSDVSGGGGSGLGSNRIELQPGDVVDLVVRVHSDGLPYAPVVGLGFALQWDGDFRDELDYLDHQVYPPLGYVDLASETLAESTSGQVGRLGEIVMYSPLPWLWHPDHDILLEVRFLVTANVTTDGIDAALFDIATLLAPDTQPAIFASQAHADAAPFCGDGVFADGETCDDGGTVSGDGCSDSCQIESGYVCGAAPSICTSVLAELPLSKDETTCVQRMHTRLRDTTRAIAGVGESCLRDVARAKTDATLPACVLADERGKITRAFALDNLSFFKSCTATGGPPPSLPVSDFAVSLASLWNQAIFWSFVFDDNPAQNLTPVAVSPSIATCQEKVIYELLDCQDRILLEFNRCAKAEMKDGMVTRLDLFACIEADLRGRVAKSCDRDDGTKLSKKDPIRKALIKHCTDGLDPGQAFPICGLSDVDAAHDCLVQKLECLTCSTLNFANVLGVDCDLLDDGQDNGSCDPAPAP